MDEPDVTVQADDLFVSSNKPPGLSEKRRAAAFALSVVTVFFVVALFADGRAHPIPGFVLAFSAAMFVCDAITAVLLFAQFVILRSPALLLVANGYVFAALVLIPYVLTYPGIVGPDPLLGGLQSSAILYVVGHAGFPLFIIGYALRKDAEDHLKLIPRDKVSAAIARSILLTVAVVVLAAWVCIAGADLFPQIILPDRTSFSRMYLLAISIPNVSSCACAFIALRMKRSSALDLWLTVVAFLYTMDVPLSYYPAPTRFSIGWYCIRAIGFLCSSVILTVLLHEIGTLYARVSRAVNAQRREREARLLTGGTVAAMIAHEVRQPLSAMIMRSETGFRWLDLTEPEVQKAKTQFKEITADGHRTAAVIEAIRTNFRADAGKTSLDVNDLIAATLNLMRDDLHHHRVAIDAEPNTRQPRIFGDRVQLQQVLLNLITNAIDAMRATDRPRVLRVACDIIDNGLAVVSVADTGTGIGQQDIARLFQPLFTTKAYGMGMGLSICRSIVEAHGGQMSVRPNEPDGTVFAFTLLADRTALTDELAEDETG
jgi:signal transduction histidine kinase